MILGVSINVRETMQKINIKGKILFDVPLKDHTTLKAGGPADIYAVPEDAYDLMLLMKHLTESSIPYFPLGAGSNVLAADSGFRGCIIDMSLFHNMTVRGLYICAGSGIRLERIIKEAASRGLTGVEHLSGIPGTFGGAVVCNAGSFGQDISSSLEWADYFDSAGNLHRYHRGESTFSYRRSPFRSGEVIIEAAVRLGIGSSSEIYSRISRARREREKRGHYSHPSAGSVFKNPPGLEVSAGQLADQVGLKGYRINDAMVSEKHGNIVVNAGHASSSDISRVISVMHQRILEETGIDLEREIIYL